VPRGRKIGIEFDDSDFLGSLAEAVQILHRDGQAAIIALAQDAGADMRRRLADDHQLAASIQVTQGTDVVEVGTSNHRARWREFGTGVFGKSHHPIVPRRKQVLAGGLRHPVEQVSGVRPRPFFRPAINLAVRRFKGWLR
jgi:hypothetical protein